MQEVSIFTLENLYRLIDGLIITLQISIISILISVLGGFILGILMTSKNRLIYFICKFFLEIVRIMPTIVWLFLVYFGLSKFLNIHMHAITASIIVFGIWGIFEMMDIVRGSVESIPKHQFESGAALGLNRIQIYIFIIIPLAMRRLIPATVNLFSRMIKTTSIVILIGVVEIIKVGQQIIETTVFSNNFAPLIIYGVIFFIYFIICYPISKFSKKLETWWS